MGDIPDTRERARSCPVGHQLRCERVAVGMVADQDEVEVVVGLRVER